MVDCGAATLGMSTMPEAAHVWVAAMVEGIQDAFKRAEG